MQRWHSHCRIMVPNSLLLTSLACSWGEDFAKHHADNNTKQVVGNSGKKTPNVPKPSETKPAVL